MFVLFLFTFLVVASVQPAKSDSADLEAITISRDGSVSPASAPILNGENSVYTLTEDIQGFIVVQRSNIVFDGANHTLKGNGLGNGTTLTGVSNVTVKDTLIEDFGNGISLVNSSGNHLLRNHISGNGVNSTLFGCHGIHVEASSPKNEISENYVTVCKIGIYVYSAYNNISANQVVNDGEGINVYGDNNNLFENYVSGCQNCGLGVNAYYAFVRGNVLKGNNGTGLLVVPPNADLPGGSKLRDNQMENNAYNFGCLGVNDVDTSNTVDGKPIYYWVNKRNLEVPADAGSVALINCLNITVQNLNLTHNQYGILLEASTNCTIEHNSFINNYWGIYLWMGSDCNLVLENFVVHNGAGMYTEYSNFNQIIANNLSHNNQGLGVVESSNSTIYGNLIEDNGNWGYGLHLDSCRYLNISANNITGNYYTLTASKVSKSIISCNNVTDGFYGIYMSGLSDSRLFHNNFINNTRQAYSYISSPNNLWDNGTSGNFWSDYNGTDQDGDGVGDTAYVVYENNQDFYPLMEPATVSLDLAAPTTSKSPPTTITPAPTSSPTVNPTESPQLPLNQTEPPSSTSPTPASTPNATSTPTSPPRIDDIIDPSTPLQATDSPSESPAPQTVPMYATVGSASIVAVVVAALAVTLKKRGI